MPSTSRRAFLASLSALGACAARHPRRLTPMAPTAASPETSYRLGWRWPAGTQHTWQTHISHASLTQVRERTEVWRYLATDLDRHGIIHLRGHLLGLGARHSDSNITSISVPTPYPAEAVAIRLRMTGRLVSCSIHDFAPALPHRLLALHLPPIAVAVGDTWDDPSLASTFAPVIPVDAPLTTRSSTTLHAPDPQSDKPWIRLNHDTTLMLGRFGPMVRITGTSLWDPALGILRDRKLTAQLDASSSPETQLTIHMQYQDSAS